jgi:hypothetical protein
VTPACSASGPDVSTLLFGSDVPLRYGRGVPERGGGPTLETDGR